MSKKLFRGILCCFIATLMMTFVACGTGADVPDDSGSGKVTIKVCDKMTSVTGVDGVKYNRQKQFDSTHPDIIVEHVNSVVTDSMKTTQQIVENINSSNACTLLLIITKNCNV